MKSTRAIVVIGILLAWLIAAGGAWWYVDKADREIPLAKIPERGGFDNRQRPDLHEPIDGDTCLAFFELGAVSGYWWSSTFPKMRWKQGNDPIEQWEGGPPFRELQGFGFRKFPKEKLPEVRVPFGINCVDSDVTDEDLKKLVHLTTLRVLELAGTKVTDAAVADLQKALPNCEIRRWREIFR